jgi:hypothetical protein
MTGRLEEARRRLSEARREELLKALNAERTRHGGFACGLCPEVFYSWCEFEWHARRRHRREFEAALRRALERVSAEMGGVPSGAVPPAVREAAPPDAVAKIGRALVLVYLPRGP